MTSCEAMRTALVELVFGELDDAAAMEVHHHLESCAPCRDEEHRLLGLREGLRPAVAPLDPALRARLRGALENLPAPRPRAPWMRPVPAYAAVAACALVASLVATVPRDAAPPHGGLRSAPHPSRMLLSETPVPFAPAGSYDTAVLVDTARMSPPDSAPLARGRFRDSL